MRSAPVIGRSAPRTHLLKRLGKPSVIINFCPSRGPLSQVLRHYNSKIPSSIATGTLSATVRNTDTSVLHNTSSQRLRQISTPLSSSKLRHDPASEYYSWEGAPLHVQERHPQDVPCGAVPNLVAYHHDLWRGQVLQHFPFRFLVLLRLCCATLPSALQLSSKHDTD